VLVRLVRAFFLRCNKRFCFCFGLELVAYPGFVDGLFDDVVSNATTATDAAS
jgi:hypothetical protein